MRSGISEVYLRDPWEHDHPRRESCDAFLTIFSDLYGESLAELGLGFDSGGCDPAFLSDDEFEMVFESIAEKLAANSQAVDLMDELNINFTLDALEMDELSHLAGIPRVPENNFASL